MKQKVVIIGTGFTSRLGVIRSVAQIGCEISVIVMSGRIGGWLLNKRRPIDCYSKYVSHVYYCYVRDEQGLLKILINHCTDEKQKVIIIPDSDFSASVIDRHLNTLSERFLFPHIHHRQGEITKWMNKCLQKEMAASVGLTVTSSHIIHVLNNRYTIPLDLQYPCFCKPLHSIHGGKQLFRRCDNMDELRAALGFIAERNSDIEILVEDFIQIEKEYAVLGFSDGMEVVIPGVVFLTKISRSHPGVALQGEILPTQGFENVITKFQTFVRQIGFVGLFDIDFFYSQGKYFFGELNMRFGGSGYAITEMGVNLPAMLVRTLIGQTILDMERKIVARSTFANDRMCIDDWYQGYLTTEEYNHIMQTVDFTFVQGNQDFGPENALKKRLRIKKFVRMLKKTF